MYKIKKFVILLGIIAIPANFLSAEVKYASATSVVLDDLQSPDTWVVDFSPLRCPVWQNADGVDEDNVSNSSDSTSQNVANPANAKTPAQGAQPADSSKQNDAASDASKWLKWITVDSLSPEKRMTTIPFALQQQKIEDAKNNGSNVASNGGQTTDTSAQQNTNHSLMGLKACWVKKSYNWVSISPKKALYTPYNPVSFSLYVWGDDYNYDLYVVVKNSAGIYYNLYLGNLHYLGWREMRINFPRYVFPANHNINSKLQIVKLKIMTNPQEDSTGFYTYFDHLVVLQGYSQKSLYDGSGLVNNNW